jgi:hypothetical protein
MPRAQAFIPLAKGIDQRLDERLREADSLQRVTNAYYRRNNALTKRRGFTQLATTMQTGLATSAGQYGVPKGLLSTGDELAIRGYRELYTYKPAAGNVAAGWLTRGELSPFTGKQRTLLADSRCVWNTDVAQVGNFVGHVQSLANVDNTTTAGTQSMTFSVETAAGEVMINKYVIGTVTGGSFNNADFTGARVVNSENPGNAALFIAHQGPRSPTYGTLKFYRWGTTTPFQTPVFSFQHTDLYYPSSVANNTRYFDATPLTAGVHSGQWAYCYIRDVSVISTSTQIHVNRRLDGASQASVNIAPPAGYAYWRMCTLHQGNFSGALYVLGVAVTAGNVEGLFLIQLNATTLATLWGPTLVDPATLANIDGESYFNLSVVEGYDSANTLRVTCVWTEGREDGTGPLILGAYLPFRRLGSCSFTTAGAATPGSFIQYQPNTELVAKPWYRDGRCYAPVRTRHENTITPSRVYDGYASEGILDLAFGDTENAVLSIYRKPKLMARFDFGSNAPYTQPFGQVWGSVNTSQAFGTLNRYSTSRILSSVGEEWDDTLLGAEEIEVDYAGKVTQAQTTRGTASLGGGTCSWYASAVTEDLGWCSAPFIVHLEPTAHGSGTLPAGTYTYIPVFEAYDEKGTLVRSLPGPPREVTFGGGGGANAVSVYVASLGLTQRYGKRRFNVALYRAGTDGVFRRCTEPSHLALDTQGNTNCIPVIVDRGDSFDVLYTQGGAELEAAGPDGAAFVTTTSKRVWLAGFFRRDRVMYSKPYDPSTANEYALAPEFNDAFAFMLPGGENVTGLCEMDDKVIVFTSSNIYAIAGNGPDDGGRGNDFSGLQLIASDTGCVDARSVVSSPVGVFFQAPSGMFLLGRDLQLKYIGAPVRDITDIYTEVTSAVLVPAQNHVRFTLRTTLLKATILVYDFDQLAWLQWTPRRNTDFGPEPLDIVGAALHQGVYYVLDSDGRVFEESSTSYLDDGNLFVPMSIETGWLQAANQSGWQRIRKIAALCKSNDPHDLTVELYQDFSASNSQQYTWTAATIANQKLNELVEAHVKQQKCTAFKLAISDAAAGTTVTGQGYECAGFTVELSGKTGLYKPGTQQRN